MRLLITTDTVGGVWTYTKELSEGLLARGHHVLLISMGRMPSQHQRSWADRTTDSFRRHFRYHATALPLEWMQDNANCYRDAEPLLLRHITRFAPDVLHLNQFCYGALPTDIPKALIAHSDVLSWSECCRGAHPQRSPWFDRYMQLVSHGLLQAHAVAAPTRWMLDALSRNYGTPPMRVVIPNGRALPLTTKAAPRKLQAITIGRVWDEGKNVRLLEDVTAPLPLLVGGELSLEAEPAFASSRLQLLGLLSEEQALRLFSESSIYIVTSRYEPFGLAPLEAALSGCAILAHDIPSLHEVWGESALYFRTAAELSTQLCMLAADSAALTRLAAKGCARARALYSQASMIDRYLDLYASLVAATAEPIVERAEAHHVT